jgi:hypothetical protein
MVLYGGQFKEGGKRSNVAESRDLGKKKDKGNFDKRRYLGEMDIKHISLKCSQKKK